ncbi:uncharacterized protein MONBRDRAFT_30342 [Monosiga brevicollis MX1]|uniref:Mitochondrial import inner membrane translocase subunit TIM17 n=1 Tax=Monosiga brevicollis TaxID=81824 RepID=A9VDP8_MONBE|nr:uncharacterized protein MONBRDRAFT_30342 [Monosiga brevicollis MX1]EDQ84358.1 predicted protein [Monosiga brevicollis MX1]|eukprot:XP_001750854.1 hypothetical protein [Monosiga brevicollis MX1]
MEPNMEEEQSFQREPCPYRILDDCGAAFAMGAIGGTIWHGVRGYRNAPTGLKYREMISAVKLRAPTVGGNFAIWGALFSTFDCSFVALRGKEDPWNAISSGFFTSGLLSIRYGPKTAFKAALGGAFILSLIEGVAIAINRFQADAAKPKLPELAEMPADPLGPPPSANAAY